MFKKSNNDLFEMPQDNKVIMHIDMNSYFATCEQQANPAWRGRPLGVVSYLHPKGTIIAASREAKEIGIGTGTKVWEAQQVCPNIILVRDDPSKYRVITERIQAIFNSYTPEVENYSIDESFLKFPIAENNMQYAINNIQSGIKSKFKIQNSKSQFKTDKPVCHLEPEMSGANTLAIQDIVCESKGQGEPKSQHNRNYGNGSRIMEHSMTRFYFRDDSVGGDDNKKNKEQDLYDEVEVIAGEIKRRIKEEVGDWLTCSVGVARTKFFAKLGSDFKKPDGLTFVNDQNVDYLLGELELTDVWGISWGLKRQLNSLGIFTPLDIKYAKPSFLLKKMGKMGYFLWSRMNGLEVDKLQFAEDSKPKSVGHSYTLLKKTADKDELALLLMKMAEKIGRRLRRKQLKGKVLWIGWRYVYGGGFGRQEKIMEATDDSWEIFRGIYKHLERKLLHDKISKLFVSVSGLEDNRRVQLSIIEDKLKKIRLVESMDKINDRYGEFTVSRGCFHNWSEEMSDRISFGQ